MLLVTSGGFNRIIAMTQWDLNRQFVKNVEERRLKRLKRKARNTAGNIGFALGVIIVLAIALLPAYVVFHFIHKYW